MRNYSWMKKMKYEYPTLYKHLKAVEELAESAREHALGIPVELARAKKELGLVQLDTIPEEWNINIPEMQETIIERFRGNYFLERALTGDLTIEGSLNELNDRVNRGVRRYLPQIKSTRHNQQVEELEKLIGNEQGEIIGLRTHNPWYPNNITTAFLWGAALGSLLGRADAEQVGDPAYTGAILGGVMFGCLSSIVIGGVATSARHIYDEDILRARYIDTIISNR